MMADSRDLVGPRIAMKGIEGFDEKKPILSSAEFGPHIYEKQRSKVSSLQRLWMSVAREAEIQQYVRGHMSWLGEHT